MKCIEVVKNKNGNNFMAARILINKLTYIGKISFCLGFTYLHAYGQTLTKPMNFNQNTLTVSTLSFKPNWAYKPTHTLHDFKTFNAMTLPFFCKIEHGIEKNSKIAFRFRVGDLNYVNMLENKR